MTTKYNIGETVLIKATVERITISKGKINYVLNTKTGSDYIYADECIIVMSEKELDGLKEKDDD